MKKLKEILHQDIYKINQKFKLKLNGNLYKFKSSIVDVVYLVDDTGSKNYPINKVKIIA